jgi:hypothetical protein
MAKQTINIGASPNDGTGTPLRTAFDYTNQNFTELYTATGPSGNNIVVPGSATITGDLTVDTSTLKVDSTNNRVGIRTASPAEPLTIDNSSGVTTGAIRIYATDQSHSRLSIQNGNGQAYHLVAGNPGASNAGFALYDNTGAATRWYVDNTGVHSWQNVGGVAGTAMTLNATGLGVKGTIGTASGDAVIAFGTRGVIVGNQASAIASGSFIDVTVVTSGAGYQGFLSVANTQDISANTRTQTTYSVFGRGTASTITQIATANGSLGGASFTVTTPSNGVIRITNTSGLAATISAQFFGGVSA